MRRAALVLVPLLLLATTAFALEVFEESFDGRRLDQSEWGMSSNMGQWRVRDGALEIQKFASLWTGVKTIHLKRRYDGGEDFTAEIELTDLDFEMRTVPEEMIAGTRIPARTATGESRIGLWVYVGSPNMSGFISEGACNGMVVQFGRYTKPDPASRMAESDSSRRIREHPYAVRVSYKVKGGKTKYVFHDLGAGTRSVTLRIEKRGMVYAFLLNGSEIHRAEAIHSAECFLSPHIALGTYGGVDGSAKIANFAVAGTRWGEGGGSGSVSSRVPGGSSSRGGEEIPPEVLIPLAIAGLLGSAGAALMLMLNPGAAASAPATAAAPATPPRAPTRTPAPAPPIPPRFDAGALEREVTDLESHGRRCFDQMKPILTAEEARLGAIEDRMEGMLSDQEGLGGDHQDLSAELADARDDLANREVLWKEQTDREWGSLRQTRDDIREEFDEVNLNWNKLDEAVRTGDHRAIAGMEGPARERFLQSARLAEEHHIPLARSEIEALRAAPHEHYDPPRSTLAGVFHDTREELASVERRLERLEREVSQYRRLLDGGYADVLDRMKGRFEGYYRAKDDVANKTVEAARELAELEAKAGAAKAGVGNLDQARGELGRLKDETLGRLEKLDELAKVKKDHARAIGDLRAYVASENPATPGFARHVASLKAAARGASEDVCTAAQEAARVTGRPVGPQPGPEEGPPYEGYEEDCDYLANQRDNLAKREAELKSYRRHHPPGSPGYDPETVKNLEADIRADRRAIRDQEERIRKAGGKVPTDWGPDLSFDPYAGVGKDVALDFRALEDERKWQDHLSAKVSAFLDRNPQYRRLRDNLYNDDGTVNIDKVGKLRLHHMEEAYRSYGPSGEELESTGNLAGLFYTGRELFTGITADGKFSWGSFLGGMGIRAVLGVASGGASEFVGMPMDALFRMHDSIERGDSGATALNKALGWALFDHGLGEVLSYGLGKGMTHATAKYPGLTSSVGEVLDGLKDLGNKPIFPRATLPIDEGLTGVKNAMRTALASGDEDAVLALYKQGGMKDIGALEANGHLTADQADGLNKVLDDFMNDSVSDGTKMASAEIRAREGVRVKSVDIGDSGSASNKLVKQSANTDFDRTLVPEFYDDDLVKWAEKKGMFTEVDGVWVPDKAKAHEILAKKYAPMHESSVDAVLQSRGLNKADVGYGSYNGFGAASGPADAYSKTFTCVRQELGRGWHQDYDLDGMFKGEYKVGGQSVIDANELLTKKFTGTLPPPPQRYQVSDWQLTISQQKMAAGRYTDIKSIAKAMERASGAASKLGKELGDPVLEAVGKRIRNNPQDVLDILRETGMSGDDFMAKSKSLILGYEVP